ncbi:MAG: acyl carrier protein [Gammaproteobacteria bacterium]
MGDDETLFGEGLGLDSVDALELVLGIEQEFGVRIGNDEMDRSAFSTVSTLGDFVLKVQATQSAKA